MSVGRAYHKAAELDGFLYVTGGSDGTRTLDVVERYDPQENIWTIVAPMTTRRQDHSVSKLSGCLYAVGGFDGVSVLNTVERLDPRVGKWEKVSPMSTCRRNLACTALDGHLHALGGNDESKRSLNSVERYNPTTDQWTAVTPMNERRSLMAGLVVNKKLYVMGGYDGATRHQSGEVFDSETNVWSTVIYKDDRTVDLMYFSRSFFLTASRLQISKMLASNSSLTPSTRMPQPLRKIAHSTQWEHSTARLTRDTTQEMEVPLTSSLSNVDIRL